MDPIVGIAKSVVDQSEALWAQATKEAKRQDDGNEITNLFIKKIRGLFRKDQSSLSQVSKSPEAREIFSRDGRLMAALRLYEMRLGIKPVETPLREIASRILEQEENFLKEARQNELEGLPPVILRGMQDGDIKRIISNYIIKKIEKMCQEKGRFLSEMAQDPEARGILDRSKILKAALETYEEDRKGQSQVPSSTGGTEFNKTQASKKVSEKTDEAPSATKIAKEIYGLKEDLWDEAVRRGPFVKGMSKEQLLSRILYNFVEIIEDKCQEEGRSLSEIARDPEARNILSRSMRLKAALGIDVK